MLSRSFAYIKAVISILILIQQKPLFSLRTIFEKVLNLNLVSGKTQGTTRYGTTTDATLSRFLTHVT